MNFQICRLWSSVSCYVLDVEPADKNIINKLGAFRDGSVQGYSFLLPKNSKRSNQRFWCTRNLHGNVWDSGCLDYSVLQNVHPKDVKAECFAIGTEKSNILNNLRENALENLEDHCGPKVQDLDKET